MKDKASLLSIVSGSLIGLYVVLMKRGLDMEFIEYFRSITLVKELISPVIIGALIFIAIGFYLFQYALFKGRSSIVNTIFNITIITFTTVVGFLFFSEFISFTKIFGIVFIIIGTIIIYYRE